MEATRQLGLSVPGDVSVAGFDDLPTASDRFPSLTTIRQPVFEMGQVGARLLHEAILAGTVPTGQLALDVRLVVRESTAQAG